MSGIFDVIAEQFQLMAIKAATEAISNPMKEMIKAQLEQIGIEADVQIDVKVLSVNLDTFKNYGGKE